MSWAKQLRLGFKKADHTLGNNMHPNAELYIKTLNMQKHIEGGYFVETFRSHYTVSDKDLSGNFYGRRQLMTSIYFLLEGKDVSKLHKVKGDEIWFFHDGSSVIIELIDKNGEIATRIMGKDVSRGELPQVIIPSDTWFTAKISEDNSYVLLGCTVAPGFEFDDFELADPSKIITDFPHLKQFILQST